MREVLVIIEADPRKSDRALDALRMSVGITLGENRVRLLVLGEAERLLRPESEGFTGHLEAREYLKALRSLHVEVEAGGSVTEACRRSDAVLRWRA